MMSTLPLYTFTAPANSLAKVSVKTQFVSFTVGLTELLIEYMVLKRALLFLKFTSVASRFPLLFIRGPSIVKPCNTKLALSLTLKPRIGVDDFKMVF